ncbi:MAG: hypothetical protein R3200_03475 [Xanthomonadales bacterium]|nr:hypothetical protein [Xanthomonadales bacterium]
MRRLLSLTGLAALAAAILWIGGERIAAPGGDARPASEAQRLADGDAAASKQDAPTSPRSPTPAPSEAVSSAPGTSHGLPYVVTPPTDPQRFRSPEFSITSEVWQLRRNAEMWRMEDYQALQSEPPVDAAAFYTAYEFLRSCRGRPTSAAQFEAQIGRYERQHERDPEAFGVEQLADALDYLEQGFDRCDGLAMDLDLAAYQALETSADLGFLPAQLEYLRSAGMLLIRDEGWLFANPDYVLRYQGRAEAFGNLALQLDLPEAYLAYAQFIFSGIAAPSDPITAYALADLAARGAHPARAEAESARRHFGERLSDDEKAEALERADELCASYCADSP